MGERIILIPGSFQKIHGEFIEFIGIVNHIRQVPNRRCAFVLNGAIYKRRLDCILSEGPRRRQQTTRDLDLDIKPNDNELMVLMKEYLRFRNVSLKEFKDLFENDSDMNNMRRVIEGDDGNLTWNRFVDLIRRLKAKYELRIIDTQFGFDSDEIVGDLNEE